LADFEQYFVANIPDIDQRQRIFGVYLQYLSELFEVAGKDFFSVSEW